MRAIKTDSRIKVQPAEAFDYFNELIEDHPYLKSTIEGVREFLTYCDRRREDPTERNYRVAIGVPDEELDEMKSFCWGYARRRLSPGHGRKYNVVRY